MSTARMSLEMSPRRVGMFGSRADSIRTWLGLEQVESVQESKGSQESKYAECVAS